MPLPSVDLPVIKALEQPFQSNRPVAVPLATFTGPAYLLWAEDLLWRAGLSERRIARAGLRSSPNKPTPVSPGTPRKQVLGRLRHPTGDKPPRHIYRASLSTVAIALIVASGLAPRWAAQQPQQTHPSFSRHTEQAGFGAASPHNAPAIGHTSLHRYICTPISGTRSNTKY